MWVSFSFAVPAARLFTREMSAVISIGMRTLKPITVQGALRDEIAHWLFLEKWDNPFPWREERHLQIELATDASQTGWGGVFSTPEKETSDYWSKDEMMLDIATREAIAVNMVLQALSDCRADVCYTLLNLAQELLQNYNDNTFSHRSSFRFHFRQRVGFSIP